MLITSPPRHEVGTGQERYFAEDHAAVEGGKFSPSLSSSEAFSDTWSPPVRLTATSPNPLWGTIMSAQICGSYSSA